MLFARKMEQFTFRRGPGAGVELVGVIPRREKGDLGSQMKQISALICLISAALAGRLVPAPLMFQAITLRVEGDGWGSGSFVRGRRPPLSVKSRSWTGEDKPAREQGFFISCYTRVPDGSRVPAMVGRVYSFLGCS
jgi:hypothetical protein